MYERVNMYSRRLSRALSEAQIHDVRVWNALRTINTLQSALSSSALETGLAASLAITSASEIREYVDEVARNWLARARSRTRVPPAHTASRILDLSMSALPTQYRARYSDEIRAELYELAQVKATRSMQVYYALRQFGRVWALRRALKDPTTHPLEPLSRATSWVLSSEIRTWLVIGLVTLAALTDVVVEQGWGSALLAAPTAWIFHQGACWLRKRLAIEVISSKKSTDGPPSG